MNKKVSKLKTLKQKQAKQQLSDREKSAQQDLKAQLQKQIDALNFGNFKPEEAYTEAEKKHVADLTEKLKKEYSEQQITEAGRPNHPTGEAGRAMLERMNDSHGPMTQWALSHLQFGEKDRVLDIGCGGGACIARLSTMVKDGTFVGIDYAKTSVEATRQFNQALIDAGKLEVIEASVSDMPFKDDTFDKIVTVESYYFWPDFETDMQEVYRVLKPSGHFLLIAEVYDHVGLPQSVLDNIQAYEMRNLDLDGFIDVFEKTGFADIAIHVKPGERWIAVEGIKAQEK